MSDTLVDLADVVISDTQPQATSQRFGRGINLSGGATLTMNRGRVTGNHDVGVLVVGRETSAELADVHILDTRSEVSNGTGGRGLSVQFGASVVLSASVISNNREVGIFRKPRGHLRRAHRE